MACPLTAEVVGAARIPQAAGDQDLVLAAAGDHLSLTLIWVTLWEKNKTKHRIEALGADPAWPHWVTRPDSALISSQNPIPKAVLAPLPQGQAPTSPRWSASHSPSPQPLTTAVAGAAGFLLEVGDESVAWLAGGGKALT